MKISNAPLALRMATLCCIGWCLMPTMNASANDKPPLVERVQGLDEPQVLRIGDAWRWGTMKIDSPLPVGYPPPTAPGVMEIKRYPSVRRAEVEGTGLRASSNRGFMPLFRHISSRGIAMTAPVEMEYGLAEDQEAWRMSFLYRNPELGPTGETENRVEVKDAPAMTVLSLGVQGRLEGETLRQAEAQLEAWLKGQTEWELDEGRRWMGYNGPSVPRNLQWWEVQVSIRRR